MKKMEFNENIHLLIVRLFSGEADAAEKKAISDWISQSAENTKLYNDLKEIWLSAGVGNNADQYHLEDAIWEFREKTGNPVCFTLDAGPNIHLLYPQRIENEVNKFIEADLTNFLHDSCWLKDQVGSGPKNI